MTKSLKTISSVVLLSFSATFLAEPAFAGFVGTEQAAANHIDRAALKSYFDRDHIAKALSEQGVTPAQAKARVDAMTDVEAERLAKHIETEPAGGDILGVVFTLFIVLLVTDILGLTKVFPFTRSTRR